MLTSEQHGRRRSWRSRPRGVRSVRGARGVRGALALEIEIEIKIEIFQQQNSRFAPSETACSHRFLIIITVALDARMRAMHAHTRSVRIDAQLRTITPT